MIDVRCQSLKISPFRISLIIRIIQVLHCLHWLFHSSQVLIIRWITYGNFALALPLLWYRLILWSLAFKAYFILLDSHPIFVLVGKHQLKTVAITFVLSKMTESYQVPLLAFRSALPQEPRLVFVLKTCFVTQLITIILTKRRGLNPRWESLYARAVRCFDTKSNLSSIGWESDSLFNLFCCRTRFQRIF